MALLPVYGILGLVTSVGGLKTPAEMYVVAFCFGLCFGPFQSFGESTLHPQPIFSPYVLRIGGKG